MHPYGSSGLFSSRIGPKKIKGLQSEISKTHFQQKSSIWFFLGFTYIFTKKVLQKEDKEEGIMKICRYLIRA